MVLLVRNLLYSNSLFSSSLGAWQFLADMPYHSISGHMLWKMFWILIDPPSDSSARSIAVQPNWRSRLNGLYRKGELCQSRSLSVVCIDPQRRDAFISRLMGMSFSEGTFLLTTFANMARCQPEETEFVEAVCLELYEVCTLVVRLESVSSKLHVLLLLR